MKQLHYLYAFILLFLMPLRLLAQDDEFDYTREFTYGINFNTNAGVIGGLAFKYASAISKNHYQRFGLEMVNIKHNKELRTQSSTGNTYIPGKALYLFAVRPQYGREFILFRKAPEEGVQMNAVIAGGPSFGITKPYYILYNANNDPRGAVSVPYDPKKHSSTSLLIYGSGPISDGLDKLKVHLGANIKGGFTFEFGRFNNSVVGVETGFLVEAYTKKIEIIPLANNRSVFSSLFITLYYGNKY